MKRATSSPLPVLNQIRCTSLSELRDGRLTPTVIPTSREKPLDEITTLAEETLRTLLPKQTLPFKPGQGYNSTQTGDYYVFAGYRNGLYAFYRQFSGNGYRLTAEAAAACFDHQHSNRKAEKAERQEASDWHNSNITI